MAEIPPWLNINPQQVTQSYAEGARLGLGAGQAQLGASLDRERMAQAAQFKQADLSQGAMFKQADLNRQLQMAAIETQQRQAQLAQQAHQAAIETALKRESLARDHMMQQQQLNIEKSYKEQMLKLQGQQLTQEGTKAFANWVSQSQRAAQLAPLQQAQAEYYRAKGQAALNPTPPRPQNLPSNVYQQRSSVLRNSIEQKKAVYLNQRKKDPALLSQIQAEEAELEQISRAEDEARNISRPGQSASVPGGGSVRVVRIY
jgi:hypothetical protein